MLDVTRNPKKLRRAERKAEHARWLRDSNFLHFHQWRSLRWFFLALLPVFVSAVAAVERGHPGDAIGIIVLGIGVASILFDALYRGAIETKQGTYLRSRKPWRYWSLISCFIAAYYGVCVGGWYVT